MKIAIVAVTLALTATAHAQSYEWSSPYGPRGPSFYSDSYGNRGQLSRPYGPNGPSYFSYDTPPHGPGVYGSGMNNSEWSSPQHLQSPSYKYGCMMYGRC